MGRAQKKAKPSAGQKRKADTLDEEIDWLIECPAKPDTKPHGVIDVFKDRDHPGVEELAIDFNITPGSKWSTAKGYTNVKCKSSETFEPSAV